MSFPSVKMVCQCIYPDQEMWKKHFPVLSVAVLVEVACAPMLCISGDWCITLQSQKYLSSPSAQMKTVLKFIFIPVQNVFMARYDCYPAFTARRLFCFIGIWESLVLLSYCFVTSHCSKPAVTKIMDGNKHRNCFCCAYLPASKFLVNIDKIPAPVVLMSFSTNMPYKRLLDV